MKRKSLLVAASGAAAMLATSKIALAQSKTVTPPVTPPTFPQGKGKEVTFTPKTAAGEIQSFRQQLRELITKIRAVRAHNRDDLGRAVQALERADILCAQSFELMLKLQ